MPRHWFPDPIWTGQPCYIIGGGPSLRGFDWEVLKEKNVVGCNVAFYMGADIVPITVFGDAAFLDQHIAGLETYAKEGGWVVTNSNRVRRDKIPSWLKCTKRQLKGLCANGLAWNGNTGAVAINLSILMGANPIYLLGYDMQVSEDGKKNYHNAYSDRPNTKTYNRFLRGMVNLVRGMKEYFPESHVINLEDDTSALEVFPKESLKLHFSKETVS